MIASPWLSILFNRGQGVLVVTQITMAMMLLVGSALLARSFVNLSNVDPGYDPQGVLTFQVSLPPGRPDSDLRSSAARLLERLQSVPGLRGVGYADSLPLTRVGASFVALRTTPASAPSQPPPPGPIQPESPFLRLVSRDFLSVIHVPLVAGRSFGAADVAGAPQVMLVNRTLARSGRLGDNPVGKRIYALGNQAWEVIGVVEDVRDDAAESAAPQVYVDFRQVPDSEPLAGVGLYFAVNTGGDGASLAWTVRGLVPQIDSQVMIETVAPMQQLVSSSMARPRLYTVLLGMFAAVAVLLAVTGIYGVMTYAVSQRVREIGIRTALGAGHRHVMGLVLGQSAVVTAVGIVLGLGAAGALTHYLEQLLYGVTPLDPRTFAGVAVLFAAIAGIAAFVPARRATRVDPVAALRFD